MAKKASQHNSPGRAAQTTRRLKAAVQAKTEDEWATLMKRQMAQAEKVQKQVQASKKEYQRENFGRAEYIQALVIQRKQKHETVKEGQRLRHKAEMEIELYEKENQKRQLDERRKAQELLAQYSNEISAKKEREERVVKAEREYAIALQEEEGRCLSRIEEDRKTIRRQWRKKLDNGYAQDIVQHRQQASQSLAELREKGPVSLERLGTHYQEQLANQHIADLKINARALSVVGILGAPTLKQQSQDSMAQAERTIDDTSINNFDRKRLQELREQHGPQVFEKLQAQVESKRRDEALKKLQSNPDLPMIADGDDAEATVQTTALWKQIDEAVKDHKRDDQLAYRKMLDEQIMQNQTLQDGIGVGSMTLHERKMNGLSNFSKNQASEETIVGILPGVYDGESTFLSLAQSHSLRRVIKAAHRQSYSQGRLPNELLKIKNQLQAEAVRLRQSDPQLQEPKPLQYSVLRPRVYEPPDLAQKDLGETFAKLAAQSLDQDEAQMALRMSGSSLHSKALPSGKVVNKKLLAQFNKQQEAQQKSQSPCSVYQSQKEMTTKIQGGPSHRLASLQDDNANQGAQASISDLMSSNSKKKVIMPADSMFKTQYKPVWEKNNRLLTEASARDGGPVKVGRWNMRVENSTIDLEGPSERVSQHHKKQHRRFRSTMLDSTSARHASLNSLTAGVKPSKKTTLAVERAIEKRRFDQKQNLDTQSVKGTGILFNNEPPTRKKNDSSTQVEKKLAETLRVERHSKFDTARRSTNSILSRKQVEEETLRQSRILNPESSLTVRRYSQQRSQLLPLGGVLGERVAKSILIYNKARKDNHSVVNVEVQTQPEKSTCLQGPPDGSKVRIAVKVQTKDERNVRNSSHATNELRPFESGDFLGHEGKIIVGGSMHLRKDSQIKSNTMSQFYSLNQEKDNRNDVLMTQQLSKRNQRSPKLRLGIMSKQAEQLELPQVQRLIPTKVYGKEMKIKQI